jgi:hypothetical protein
MQPRRSSSRSVLPVLRLHSPLARLASRNRLTQTAAFIAAVRQTILAMYSNSPQALADFGMTPGKTPTPLTPAQKVVAAAKRKTRLAPSHDEREGEGQHHGDADRYTA